MLNKKPLRVVMVDDDSHDVFLTKMALRKSSLDFEFVGLASGNDLFDYISRHGTDEIVSMVHTLVPQQDYAYAV